MRLELRRRWFTRETTIGDLFVDGVWICYALEDRDRGLERSMLLTTIERMKIHGKTAIPTGRYRVELTPSARFKRVLPLLIDVPGFAGVRIHEGNDAGDTEGCPLVGLERGPDSIGQSSAAMRTLLPLLEQAVIRKEPITIEVSRMPAPKTGG